MCLAAALLLAACTTTTDTQSIQDPPIPGTIAAYEAEAAAVEHDFEVLADVDASAGEVLAQLDGTPNGDGSSIDASLEITVPVSGTYTLWARMWAPDGSSDAIYLGLDGDLRRVFPSVWGEYQWLELTTTELDDGPHTIDIGRGESGLRLDVLALSSDVRVSPTQLDEYLGVESGGEAPAPEDEPGEEPADVPGETPSTDPGDEPSDDPSDPAEKPRDPRDPPAQEGVARMSAKGNTAFDRSKLSSEARLWYDRLWAAINHDRPVVNAQKISQSDDSYAFARPLFQQHSALVLGLRATGDLKFLDEIDRSAQNLRKDLYDGWCGGVASTVKLGAYGTMKAKDGYLNFRRRANLDPSHNTYCRDVSDLEETLLHGHIAMLMNAYDENRGVPSPSGIDYGERADFWLNYLVNHFEAKWRERSGVQFPKMDFINMKFCHTFNQFNMYYYYVGKALTKRGDAKGQAYLDYANHTTDRMFEAPYVPGKKPGGFVDTNTPLGPAYVYSFGAPGRSGSFGATNMEACPTTYARYAIASQVEMYFEGFDRWDDASLSRIATGIAYFVIDTDKVKSSSATIAAGVTGSKTVESIPPTEYRNRFPVQTYSTTNMAALAMWDDSGRIARFNDQLYDLLEGSAGRPQRVNIPAAELMRAQYR